ncbi:hypothetical protein E2320_006745 [Naja naja]|nr:hypothetical protein E2320_006745 [Naja naja]
MSRIFDTSSVSTLQVPSPEKRVKLALFLPQWHFPAPLAECLESQGLAVVSFVTTKATGLDPGHKRGAGKATRAPSTSRCSSPVKDGPDSRAVGTVPVDVEACGQEDPVFDGDGSVGERGDEQLVPTCRKARGGERSHPKTSKVGEGRSLHPRASFHQEINYLVSGWNKIEYQASLSHEAQ